MPEQLEWLPYEDGQTLQFVNAENDSIKTIQIAVEERRSDGACVTIYESEPSTSRGFSLPNFYNNANDFGLLTLGAYIDDRIKVYDLFSNTDRISIDLVNLIEYDDGGFEPLEVNIMERTVNGTNYTDVIRLKERKSTNNNETFIAKGIGIIEYTYENRSWYLLP